MGHLDFMDIFVTLILCLVLFPLSLGFMKKQEALAVSSNSVSDKNVRLVLDRDTDSEISGKDYNAWEVLLATQIQSYYMAEPKTLSVMGEKDGTEEYLLPIDVTATFNEDRDVFVEQFRDHMSRVGGLKSSVTLQGETGESESKEVTARYQLKLNQGKKLDTTSDDFYYFRKVE